MGCNFIDINEQRCNFNYELKYLLFRNPTTRVSQEIEICPRHFGTEVEEPLILPIRLLRIKKDNLFATISRERQIAKQYDSYYDYTQRKHQLDTIKERIRILISLKCSNILCGAVLPIMSPLYSMMVITHSGKVSYKFYFCSKDCWDKMRIRTGALLPEKARKGIPLSHYT